MSRTNGRINRTKGRISRSGNDEKSSRKMRSRRILKAKDSKGADKVKESAGKAEESAGTGIKEESAWKEESSAAAGT